MKKIKIRQATSTTIVDGGPVDVRHKKIWNSPSEALLELDKYATDNEMVTARYVGLILPVKENNIQLEYWFVDGITDTHFVKKTTVPIDTTIFYPKTGGDVTGPVNVKGGNHLTLQAATGSSDSGDLIFKNGAGVEQARLYYNGIDNGDQFYASFNGVFPAKQLAYKQDIDGTFILNQANGHQVASSSITGSYKAINDTSNSMCGLNPFGISISDLLNSQFSTHTAGFLEFITNTNKSMYLVNGIKYTKDGNDMFILPPVTINAGENILRLPTGSGTLATTANLSNSTTELQNSINAKANLSGAIFTGDIQIPAIPTGATSAITKSYLDNLLTGISWKNAVRVATTTNIILSGIQTIDGVTGIANSRVLVKNQTDQTQNGPYVMSSGAWVRVLDADTEQEIVTATMAVTLGTVNKNTQWTCTNSSIELLGTSLITFGQISGASTYTNGNGLTLTGNVFAVDNTVVRNNQSNTYTVGAKQIFVGGATNSGIGFAGGLTVNPSALSIGDFWFRIDENKFRYFDGTIAQAFVTEQLAQILTNKTFGTGNTWNGNIIAPAFLDLSLYATKASPTFTGTPITTHLQVNGLFEMPTKGGNNRAAYFTSGGFLESSAAILFPNGSGITLTSSPVASAGTYEFITRNTNSGAFEKLASATIALASDIPAITSYIHNNTGAVQNAGFYISGEAKINNTVFINTSDKISIGGGSSIQIGNSAIASNTGIAIGLGANTNFHSIVIGREATATGNNQLIFGGGGGANATQITQVYFSGINSSTGLSTNSTDLFASSGTPTVVDAPGGSMTINSGRGTGAGIGGDIVLKTPSSVVSGIGVQTLTDRFRIKQGGDIIVSSLAGTGTRMVTASATGLLSFATIPAGSGSGTVTNVTSANADITIATGTTTPILTLNSGSGANQIVKRDVNGLIAGVAPGGSESYIHNQSTSAQSASLWVGGNIKSNAYVYANTVNAFSMEATQFGTTSYFNYDGLRVFAGGGQNTKYGFTGISFSNVHDSFIQNFSPFDGALGSTKNISLPNASGTVALTNQIIPVSSANSDIAVSNNVLTLNTGLGAFKVVKRDGAGNIDNAGFYYGGKGYGATESFQVRTTPGSSFPYTNTSLDRYEVQGLSGYSYLQGHRLVFAGGSGHGGFIQELLPATTLTANSIITLPNIASGTVALTSDVAAVTGYTISTKTANYTETATVGTVILKANTTTAGFTIILPTAIGNKATIVIKKSVVANSVTIATTASQTIDDSATVTISTQYQSVTLVSDNVNWIII